MRNTSSYGCRASATKSTEDDSHPRAARFWCSLERALGSRGKPCGTGYEQSFDQWHRVGIEVEIENTNAYVYASVALPSSSLLLDTSLNANTANTQPDVQTALPAPVVLPHSVGSASGPHRGSLYFL